MAPGLQLRLEDGPTNLDTIEMHVYVAFGTVGHGENGGCIIRSEGLVGELPRQQRVQLRL